MNVPSDGGFAVGWITLSLINSGRAQGKGHPGLLGWLASLLLGPIATLIIVVGPRVIDKPPGE